MRIESLKRLFSNELDHFLITDPKNLFYFTGFKGGGVLITPLEGKPTLYVPEMESEAAKKRAVGCEVESFERREKIENRILKVLKDKKPRKVGIDNFSLSLYLTLVKKGRGIKFLHKTDLIWNLRKKKNEEEIQNIKKAAEIAAHGFKTASEIIKPGRSEIEIAAEAEYAMRRHGSEGVPFDSIIASGQNSALPHASATEKKIRNEDLVIVDIGAIYRGYCVDITRTFVAGKATARQKKIYNAVLEAHNAALKALQENTKASKVDSKARQILRKRGYEKFFIHSLGHGVGLDVHEPPRLTQNSKEILQAGYVITDEPGVYISNYGGVRIEDTLAVRRDRAENLVNIPYELD